MESRPQEYACLGFVYHTRVGSDEQEQRFIEDELLLWERCLQQLSRTAQKRVLVRFVYSWALAAETEGHERQIEIAKRLGESGAALMPCIMWTPIGKTISHNPISPPHPFYYPHVLEKGRWFLRAIREYASPFAQFWAEVNGYCYWSREDDPYFSHFACLHRVAAKMLRDEGFEVVLPGPIYNSGDGMAWLKLMCCYNVLEECSLIGMHAFPSVWKNEGCNINSILAQYASVLDEFGYSLPFMVCETGYATTTSSTSPAIEEDIEEIMQEDFVRALVYDIRGHPLVRTPPLWHTLCDIPHFFRSATVAHNGAEVDIREHRCGLWRDPETPKLSWKMLETLTL